MLDYENNRTREEVERQRERILKAQQVVSVREYSFSGDLIVDSSGAFDISLPVLANVSALIEALRLGGSYELFHQILYQITLFAGRVNVDVSRSRDELLIRAFLVPCFT